MTRDTTPDELRELLEKASGGLPWSYRPWEHDDWGTIRTTGNSVAATSRQPIQDDRSLDDHRTAKTDPYEPYGRLIVAAVNSLPALLEAQAEAERLRGALQRIEKWFGEFPETGRTWESGEPMSYGAAYGSNGERDYMRSIARSALSPTQREGN